jgi:hypothetical protein
LRRHHAQFASAIWVLAFLTVTDGDQKSIPRFDYLLATGAKRVTGIHFVVRFLNILEASVDKNVCPISADEALGHCYKITVHAERRSYPRTHVSDYRYGNERQSERSEVSPRCPSTHGKLALSEACTPGSNSQTLSGNAT